MFLHQLFGIFRPLQKHKIMMERYNCRVQRLRCTDSGAGAFGVCNGRAWKPSPTVFHIFRKERPFLFRLGFGVAVHTDNS